MIPSPSRIPPYPWRSDHCTAPCTRRSSAGRGTHAERHCQFVGPQGPPSRHQIPPSSPPAAMAIPLLGVERIGTAQGKNERQVNSKCDSPEFGPLGVGQYWHRLSPVILPENRNFSRFAKYSVANGP